MRDIEQEFMWLLNEVLQTDPNFVIQLLDHKVEASKEVRELLNMKGTQATFLSIINEVLRRQKATGVIGADIRYFDDEQEKSQELVDIKFFHIVNY